MHRKLNPVALDAFIAYATRFGMDVSERFYIGHPGEHMRFNDENTNEAYDMFLAGFAAASNNVEST